MLRKYRKFLLLLLGVVALAFFLYKFRNSISLQGFHWSQLAFAGGTFGRPKGQVSGLPLWAIYLIWLAVVAILYKPCQWFARYRKTHSYFLLKYI